MINARGTASASLLNHLLKEKPPLLDLGLVTGGERKRILFKGYRLPLAARRSDG